MLEPNKVCSSFRKSSNSLSKCLYHFAFPPEFLVLYTLVSSWSSQCLDFSYFKREIVHPSPFKMMEIKAKCSKLIHKKLFKSHVYSLTCDRKRVLASCMKKLENKNKFKTLYRISTRMS